jgi:hypothetical protein
MWAPIVAKPREKSGDITRISIPRTNKSTDLVKNIHWHQSVILRTRKDTKAAIT